MTGLISQGQAPTKGHMRGVLGNEWLLQAKLFEQMPGKVESVEDHKCADFKIDIMYMICTVYTEMFFVHSIHVVYRLWREG